MPRPRLAALGMLCMALLAACAPAPSQPAAALDPTATVAPTSAPAPTAAPTATPVPVFAAGSTVGGVDVAGLSFDEAAARLEERLATPAGPLTLAAGSATLELAPASIALAVPVAELLDQARPAFEGGRPADIPAAVTFDEAALREELTALVAANPASSEVAVLAVSDAFTATDVISRSFVYTPGLTLDLDGAVQQIRLALAADPTLSEPIALAPADGAASARVPFERLREELVAMSEELPGVLGVHLIDLESGETLGLNDRTVFAGASTIKTAVMLFLYINLDEFTERQSFWLNEMIRYSDNLSANDLLAAAVGGQGTDNAFIGADEMSTLLQEELGLRHTYLYVPYETTDYIKLYKPKFRCGPQGRVGEAPYTEMGNCLRAEPASMARLYQLIDQCAEGEGELLEQYERLSAERCQEMLDWLARNGDKTRIVAGVPQGTRVEHKSGWIEDMQADNGIVRSPGGDYILSIYYYKPLAGNREYWTNEEMAPVVEAVSRLVYTAYNPLEPGEANP